MTLPLVALPQTELLPINEHESDWIGRPTDDNRIKVLRLDVEAGVWVILAELKPGAEVKLHYHTGEAEVFTLQGRWNYKEYANQPQTAGSYLYEPAGSVHTFVVPQENTEDTIIFVRVRGANVNFNEDATFNSILDAASLTFVVERAAQKYGTKVRYIRGGEAVEVGA